MAMWNPNRKKEAPKGGDEGAPVAAILPGGASPAPEELEGGLHGMGLDGAVYRKDGSPRQGGVDLKG